MIKFPLKLSVGKNKEKDRIRQELEALAAKSGYTLDELLGEAREKVRKVTQPVAVKYRHPLDTTLTWTGRGRQPKWVVAFLNAGGTQEQLAV